MRNPPRIILASASPRRKDILKQIGLNFTIDQSRFEECIVGGLKPDALARFLSKEKAHDVARRHKDAIVIAADTLVVSRGRIFGKPRDAAEATKMLTSLSGKVHSVVTGFTIIDTRNEREISRSVETKVFFRRLSRDEISSYVSSGEPLDKAGAYGIQGLGAVLIRKIEGDYFNVVGLPLNALVESLKKFGVKVLG